MADLNTECCTPAAQETCCEPSAKASCCGDAHSSECGCSSARSPHPSTSIAAATVDQVREVVRKKYAAAAALGAACCGPAEDDGVFGGSLYAGSGESGAPADAINASLGCGVPTAVADLHDGETVLDLGSGAGTDVLISARRVGPTGRAIGLDMTDEMLELARTNATEAGLENVEFVKGYLEDMPLDDQTVDVVISNCVINLSGDKPQVIREAGVCSAPVAASPFPT